MTDNDNQVSAHYNPQMGKIEYVEAIQAAKHIIRMLGGSVIYGVAVDDIDKAPEWLQELILKSLSDKGKLNG